MKMFVANGTRQHINFMYRLPETNKTREQTIRVGEQIQVSGDLNQVDIDSIIAQHAVYGLVRSDEIDRKGQKPTMCYQLDKPIHPSVIKRLEMINQGILDQRGAEARQNAAIVMANELGADMQRKQSNLSGFEVDVVEQPRSGASADDLVKETVVMTKEGQEPPKPKATTRRRR